jgi:hypothetical protein
MRKLLVFLPLAAAVLLCLGIANGEEAAPLPDRGVPVMTMFPNPEDTIQYDSPPPAVPFGAPLGPYWAVRFTPAGNCTVKAGLVALELIAGTPVCSLFVWDDAAGFPGPLVGGTPIAFVPAGYPTFDQVDLTSAYVDADDFWIGYFAFEDARDIAWAVTDGVTDSLRSYLSADRTTWTLLSSGDPPIPGDLLIRAIVECPAAVPDVGVDSVLAPPDTVPCLAPAPVSARVCNVGDTTVAFDVTAEIPGLYADTAFAVLLDPGACSTLTFANWDVPDSHGVCFDVTFRTWLAIDTNPLNDVLGTVSCADCPAAAPDVAVDSILAPPDTVPCLTPAPVSARVCNVGDTTVTFEVEALIPGLYADTVLGVNLGPAACSTLTFANWDVPDSHGVCFDVTFRTLLAIDVDPANDTLSTVSCADCPPAAHDIGLISIDNPPDTVYADSTVPVAASIVNYGDSTESSFFVSMEIGVYSDAKMVATVAPGETVQVAFDDWVVPPDCDTTYTAVSVALLGADENPLNDTLFKDVFAMCEPGVSEGWTHGGVGKLALYDSRPNPFVTSTEILYQLPSEGYVSLRVYDHAGRLIRSLADGTEQAGAGRVLWDGRDGRGELAKSGIYFARLDVREPDTSTAFSETRKLILLR